MSYDTSPAGLSAGASRQDAALADAKSGSPKGVSGAYNDVPNQDSPSPANIATNEINKPATPMPPGSTSDTGRVSP